VIEAHLLKLRARDEISADEEQAMRSIVGKVVDLEADRTVIRHGEELHNSTLLLSGWLARAKDLPGGERQLTELHVPGDFADLHSFTLKQLDHDVVSLTRCRVALVPHEGLLTITERFPHLARVLWLMTNIDASIQREWTLSLGQRAAIARMAQLFCELNVRLAVVGLSNQDTYDFPLTQVELGQTLGLTSVHVNRTLQELRRRGVISLEAGRLTIHDLDALKRIAEFDGQYLYLQRRPR
jgi:CRP-like cAMP-binding protein